MWTDAAWFIVGLSGLLVAASIGLPVFFNLRSMRFLGDIRGAERFSSAEAPIVRVIVPACNEAAMIRQCLTSLSDQDYPNLEVVAVNDRSTDETGRIMDDVAAANPRVRVVHIAELPAGWLGKNHANHLGAGAARGDWLLFTDGDIIFEPDAIRRAVAHAETENLDHFTLFPGMMPGGYWESAAISFFACLFIAHAKPWYIRDPSRPASFCGVGAFNLVRASAYRAIGGHTRLAMEVVDDMKLGKLLKRAGFVSDVMSGDPKIRVRWHVGLRGVIRGLEKNGFAGSDYYLPKTTYGVCMMTFLAVMPIAGVIGAPGWLKLIYVSWLAASIIMLAGAAPKHRSRVAIGLAFPVVCMVMAFAVGRSTFLTIVGGGIRWRGTFYPLKELRAGVV